MRQLWGGRYERAKDPDAHLHPRREEAPWLGRRFPWPPDLTGWGRAAPGDAAVPEPAAAGAEAGGERRLWWAAGVPAGQGSPHRRPG